jgi:hypothetical protein
MTLVGAAISMIWTVKGKTICLMTTLLVLMTMAAMQTTTATMMMVILKTTIPLDRHRFAEKVPPQRVKGEQSARCRHRALPRSR